ncbi:hypothetical protein OE810_08200 [Rhodobacteraceae bacterium XHP0102]|nr:hypothetical protein [Rhodobacteraceae bacterium XHP0102]
MIWLLLVTDAASRFPMGVSAALDRLMALRVAHEAVVLIDAGSRDDTVAQVADHIAFAPEWGDLRPLLFHTTPCAARNLGDQECFEIGRALVADDVPIYRRTERDLVSDLECARAQGAIFAVTAHDLVPPPATPQIDRASLRIYLAGPHRHLSPLAAEGLVWPARLIQVQSADDADMVVFTHPHDPQKCDPESAACLTAQKPPKLCVYSPEPMWDLLFLSHPDGDVTWVDLPLIGPRQAAVLTHQNAALFDFAALPFYIMAETQMRARLKDLITQNAKRDAEDWMSMWRAARFDAAGYVTHRRGPAHWQRQGTMQALSAWRSLVAVELQVQGDALIAGQGWTHQIRRAEIPDWHSEKLRALRARARACLAIENTIAPHYVSEKLFDAFACGMRPISCGGVDPRLGIEVDAVITLDPADSPNAAAAQVMRAAQKDAQNPAAFVRTMRQLATRLNDPDLHAQELHRIERAFWLDMTRAYDQ